MKSRGEAAETLALEYLRGLGLKLIARNYRCRFGEIDLVLRDGASLVFVEVRLRGTSGFGGAAGSITRDKQRKLKSAANHFLASYPHPPACRFDVVLLDKLDPDSIEWLKSAFS